MEFSDGMKFNTQAEPHTERRRDGWYVVGGNVLIPVADYEEGECEVARMRERLKLVADIGRNRK